MTSRKAIVAQVPQSSKEELPTVIVVTNKTLFEAGERAHNSCFVSGGGTKSPGMSNG